MADDLTRHLDTILRTAQTLRSHAADLATFAWEPPVTGHEPVEASRVDWTPRTGSQAALALHRHLSVDLGRVAALLVGHERALRDVFGARRAIYIEQARGTLNSRSDLDAAHDAQTRRRQRGDYSPTPFVDPHPGKGP